MEIKEYNTYKYYDSIYNKVGDKVKEKYSIGETAVLLGVSTQTLRYYDKIGLLPPKYIDESTGYRFYSYNQFHYIDKIKYLQSFGLSLEEIKVIIKSSSVDSLIAYLQQKKKEREKELLDLKAQIKDIDWYINYFIYIDKNKITDNVYRRELSKRYIIKTPCYYKEELANMEINLAEMKSRKEYSELKFHRQYGYKIDFESFLKCSFYPKEYFVFLSEKPNLDEKLYDELPQGEYLCFKTQILNENWNPDILKDYFPNGKIPKLALALEFEDNLHEWQDAWYEVQILL